MIFSDPRPRRLNRLLQVQKLAVSLILAIKWKLFSDGHSFIRPGKPVHEKKPSATFAPFPPEADYPSFTVWSQSSEIKPFESRKQYSPVNIITLLMFDGDAKKCLDHLAAKYLKNPVTNKK